MNKKIAQAASILFGLITLAWALSVQAGDVFPGKRWSSFESPEAAGWSSEKLKLADDFARTLQTDSYLVIQHGRIVHEYGKIDRAINIQSMRKSVLSVLIGMYVDRGIFKLEPTMADLGITDNGGLSSAEQQATVRQLMQARSGIYHPGALESLQFAGPRPARDSFKPGEHWYYNNWDFNVLGTIFKKFTGKTVNESLRDDLAKPLQLEDFDFARDTGFVHEDVSEHPAYIMRLSARDMARIGLLMARDGRWQKGRLISSQWINESTTSYSEASSGIEFGYMWWIRSGESKFGGKLSEKRRFSAIGDGRQYMGIVPGLDLVIVHNVDNETSLNRNVPMPQLEKLVGLIMDASH